ncbi:hypothetical protein PGLA_23300 [Paenibacillus glacialis]|uniref:Uncharacterized protein n=1 Tax=Paenibacillus glacialis TaxID=494026 RepID=A0A168D476_9BACL|nr:hypothetical protein PGLA_23300 [Paenibacillus glacialis]
MRNIVSTNKGSGINAEQDKWLGSRSVSACASSGVLGRAGQVHIANKKDGLIFRAYHEGCIF